MGVHVIAARLGLHVAAITGTLWRAKQNQR
jgi:hypothetical protein